MLPPNNSLAPNQIHLIFSAMVMLPGMLMGAQSQSPLNWSADGELLVTVENDRRILRMQDNVKISQDSINISGSSAIFEYTIDTQELLRVTVLGAPVRYSQASESSAEPVTGKSDTLIFYDDETLFLGRFLERSLNYRIKCRRLFCMQPMARTLDNMCFRIREITTYLIAVSRCYVVRLTSLNK